MKIVVIGRIGLIGSKVVAKLEGHRHEAIAASPEMGVNTLTGAGLADALAGAQVVVDVSNSPSFEGGPAWDFFTTATGNLLTAAEAAGVSHYVALSVVGTHRLLASGYFRAKSAQGKARRRSGNAVFDRARDTVLRVRRPHRRFGDRRRHRADIGRPVPADDVATAVACVAPRQPVAGVREVAGPDRYPLDDLVRAQLRAQGDTTRPVVTDPQARYFGVPLDNLTLIPAATATVFPTRFDAWLIDSAPLWVR